MRVTNDSAYILHRRPYRETSQIIELFTREHGRVAVLSRGSRSARSKTAGLLQPFQCLTLNWQGRGELPTLTQVDVVAGDRRNLRSKSLLSAMYVNELMMHLLHKYDVHDEIFDRYEKLLDELATQPEVEPVLRLFERDLLHHLGFGLNLSIDADTGQPVRSEQNYQYHHEHGPVAIAGQGSSASPVLSGDSLLALASGELRSARHTSEAKRLMRFVITHHLGGRQLRSRELFRRSSQGHGSS